MKTIRRDMLLRRVQAGKVELLESYHFDDMTGTSGHDRNKPGKPVAIMPSNWRDRKDGVAYLFESDFKSKSGLAYWRDETNHIAILIVHGNCNYTLRVK